MEKKILTTETYLTATAENCLAGGGEMGAMMRSYNWANTSLGPVEYWPQSLKTAVNLMLNSRYPMFLGWGRDLIFCYNDAYIPVLGARHPAALGQPAAQVWAEIWNVLGPQTEVVLREGRATWNDEALLVMERNNFPEETYFTWSYSPIRDDGGRVNGVFCACAEETAKVIGKRRLKMLRDLGERTLVKSKNAEDACRAAALTLAGDPHDVPFALIYLLDERGEQARLCEAVGLTGDTAPAPDRIQLGGEADVWNLNRVLAANETQVVENLVERFGHLRAGAWAEDFVRQAFVTPLAKAGVQDFPAGFLVAGISPRLPFDDEYRGFLQLAAGHIAMAIANARAYEEERKRAEALAKIDRAKTAFFSNVSHEFRTPLTLMLGPLEDALAEDDLPTNTREQLEVAHRNSLRLLKLVNTLLDFSRIEAGRIQAVYEPVELGPFTADLASIFRSAIERAGLKLLVDCPSLEQEVYIDREMWEKIVLNLLSNAFKFTFEGEIEVCLRPAGEAAELSVRDTGTGIPAEEIPQLFERFHRVKDARSRSYEGSGIGLALVQELVRLHGGSVLVQSEVDLGSTFTVRIPLGKSHLPAERIGVARALSSTGLPGEAFVEEVLRWLPDESQQAEETATSSDLKSQSLSSRILLADDNADMRDYMRRLLGGQYEVEAVADGEAALQAAREGKADLVLADVMMPRMNGFELLRNLRADERTRLLPVILLSARAGEESRVEGLAAGADDYLSKPFSARELLARIEAHLRLQRLRHEAAARERDLRADAEAARAQVQPVLESIRDAFSAFDRDWHYTYINDRGLQLSGLQREEFEGRTLWEVFPDLIGTEFETRLRQAMENRGAVSFETYYAPWDRWVENRVYPSADGVSLFTTDISDRKEAEEKLKLANYRFRVAEEAARGFSYEWNLETDTVTRSEGIIQVLGYEPGELANTWEAWADLIHPDEAKFSKEEAKQFLNDYKKETYGFEYRARHRQGHYCWIYECAAILRDEHGRVRRVIGQTVDITDRKNAEEALRSAIEREKALRTKAEEANRLKDEFLAVVTHELRTPLNSIHGWAGMLHGGRLSSEQAQKAIQTIDRNAKIQKQLIDDLLDVSRIVTGKMRLNIREIALHKVIQAAVETVRHAAEAKGIDLCVEGEGLTRNSVVLLSGDFDRLQQVIWNLVSNAIKFTSENGRVVVSMKRTDSHAEILVTDTGKGIKPDFLPYVFDRFRQEDASKSRKEGGLGLGLAIVRQLVELHGGEVRAESPGEGLGATFIVSLPLPSTAKPQMQAAAAPQNSTDSRLPSVLIGMRVLVVDDERDAQALIRVILERDGAEVRAVFSAAEAFALLDEWKPDLIVADIGMPDMDGYEFMRSLRGRSRERGGLLPAVALTAYSRIEDRVQAMAAGYQMHVAKPVEPDEFLMVVATLMGRQATNL